MAMQPLSVGRIAANDDMLSSEDSELLSILVVPKPRELLKQCFKARGYNGKDAETEARYLIDLAKEGRPAIADHFHICDETVRRFDEWQHCARDVLYFADTYIYVEKPIEGRMETNVVQYQSTAVEKQLLYLLNEARVNPKAPQVICVKKSRRVGYSATVGIFALHSCNFYGSEYAPLISCDREASERWLRKILISYEKLPDWLKARYIINRTRLIEFDKRSRIEALPATGKAARGEGTTIVPIDEGALIQNAGKWNALYQGASGSSDNVAVIVVGSTCNCGEDTPYAQFIEGAHRGEFPGVAYLEMPWDSMTGHDRAWLAKERLKYSTYAQFATEILMKWEGSSRPCLPIEILEAWTDELIANPVEYDKTYARTFLPPQNPEMKSTIAGTHIVRRYNKPIAQHQYMLALDMALGRGKDRQAGILIDFTTSPREVTLVYHSSHNSVERVVDHGFKISSAFGNCKIIFENKGINQRAIGYAEVQGGLDRVWRRPPKFRGFSKFFGEATRVDEQEYGFITTPDSKVEIMEFASNAIERQDVRIYDQALLGELKGLTVKGSKRIEADGQGHDDLAMAFMICLFIGSREYHMSEHLTELATHGPEYEAGGLMVAEDAYDTSYLGEFQDEGVESYLH